MARVTTARQRALVAARNTRNSTASAAGRVAPAVNPPIVAEEETVDNPISLEDLNRRRLQDQIDQNAAIAAQTLQFAVAVEERLIIREALEHQARLPPIINQSLPHVDPASESLILSLEFISFSNKFPAVPEKQLVRVFKWPNRDYEAAEIYKLTISDSFDAKDDRYEQTLVNGSMTIHKKRGGKENYTSLSIWSPAFLQYSLIRLVAGRDIELHHKQQSFHQRIARLEKIYAWDGVLSLAMHLHQLYINDPAGSWSIPAEEIDARCVNKSFTSPPTGSRAPSLVGRTTAP
jgi:hypothetical protein